MRWFMWLTHSHSRRASKTTKAAAAEQTHKCFILLPIFFLFWCFSPSHEAFLYASLKRPKYSSLSKPPLVSDVTASSCWTSIKVSKFPLQVCADSICQNILSQSFIHNGRLHHQKCFSCTFTILTFEWLHPLGYLHFSTSSETCISTWHHSRPTRALNFLRFSSFCVSST